MIAVVNSGGANIASVRFALDRLGVDSEFTSNPEVVSKADRVIFPGVGSAGAAMKALGDSNMTECLRSLRQPVLGICLGMQLLFDESEEGDVECLGVIPGKVRKLKKNPDIQIPHMGWNSIQFEETPILNDIEAGERFYFVHSFAAPEGSHVIARTDYGQSIPAMVQRENFFGAQFHPERSSTAGAQVLRNFLKL